MQRTTFLFLFFIAFSLIATAQEESEIVKSVDDLRLKWDEEAEKLQSYEGLGEFCSNADYRKKIIGMLDEIHHYDTLLYGIVTRKFKESEDPEAKETLADIDKLEIDYKTKSFRRFIHSECNTFNDIEKNLGSAKGSEYKKEVNALEKELKKYVKEITQQIDVIDDHVHHLHLGEGG